MSAHKLKWNSSSNPSRMFDQQTLLEFYWHSKKQKQKFNINLMAAIFFKRVAKIIRVKYKSIFVEYSLRHDIIGFKIKR